jgi:hypothetical protein
MKIAYFKSTLLRTRFYLTTCSAKLVFFFRVYKKFLNTNLLQNNFWFICKETRSPESGGGGRPPGPIVGGGGSGPLLILPDN